MKLNKKQALNSFNEIRYYSDSPANGPAIYDLMAPYDEDEIHCDTCSCRHYVFYTGWSFQTTDEQFKNMTVSQRKVYIISHPKLVFNPNKRLTKIFPLD